jgi:hypothetical protein
MTDNKKNRKHLHKNKNDDSHKKNSMKESSKKENDSENRNSDLFAITIFILVIGAIFLLIFALPKLTNLNKTANNKYYFNGFLFEKTGPVWYTQIQKGEELFDIPMHFGPKELTFINISNETSSKMKWFFNELIPRYPESKTGFYLSYLTFDPYDNLSSVSLSATEISMKLLQTSRIKMIAACTDNSTGTGCEGRIKVTCDATDFPTVFIDQNEELNVPNVRIEEKCMIIEGKNSDLIKITDRVLYQFFGIMN